MPLLRRCSLLIGWQAAGVGIGRWYQRMELELGSGSADVRRPFRFGQRRGLLAGWQAASFGIELRDSQAVVWVFVAWTLAKVRVAQRLDMHKCCLLVVRMKPYSYSLNTM